MKIVIASLAVPIGFALLDIVWGFIELAIHINDNVMNNPTIGNVWLTPIPGFVVIAFYGNSALLAFFLVAIYHLLKG